MFNYKNQNVEEIIEYNQFKIYNNYIPPSSSISSSSSNLNSNNSNKYLSNKNNNVILNSRHSKFGSAFKLKNNSGLPQIISNSFQLINDNNDSTNSTKKKSVNKKNASFIINSYSKSISNSTIDNNKLHTVLFEFSFNFIKHCFEIYIKNIKNEFRKDTSKLE